MSALSFHPAIQDGLLESPTITQLEGRNSIVPNILVQCIPRYAEILRGRANVHNFPGLYHPEKPVELRFPAIQPRTAMKKSGNTVDSAYTP
jgi:hypothetical protein